MSLFHEVQDITREHFNHSINRANQFYIADMKLSKRKIVENPKTDLNFTGFSQIL